MWEEVFPVLVGHVPSSDLFVAVSQKPRGVRGRHETLIAAFFDKLLFIV